MHAVGGQWSLNHANRLPYVWAMCGRPASACLTIKHYMLRARWQAALQDIVITAGAGRELCGCPDVSGKKAGKREAGKEKSRKKTGCNIS